VKKSFGSLQEFNITIKHWPDIDVFAYKKGVVP
jgi:hypothetical protein